LYLRIAEISEHATKEFSLEKNLNKMEKEWADLEFGIVEWRDSGISILHGSEIEDIQLKLDEHTINAQTIRANPFVK
jgi:dynein heavy chain, axonemal